MTLREKLLHYTHDLDGDCDLKKEAIATIEQIAQYMDEDELLYHSRPLALAYLALTEDGSVSVTQCKDCIRYRFGLNGGPENWCNRTGFVQRDDDFCSYGKPKMDGDENTKDMIIKNV